MDFLSEAIQFTVKAHDGIQRKCGNNPYILHPLEVATIISSMTNDENIIAAGLLHDVVEDTDYSLSDIEERFGSRVAELVACETEDKLKGLSPALSWKIRKEKSLEHLKSSDDEAVAMLWLADKLSNIRSVDRELSKRGDVIWQDFNQKNPDEHRWYYEEVAELTERLSDYPVWKEFKILTEKVFGKG